MECVCKGMLKSCPLCQGTGNVTCEECLGTQYKMQEVVSSSNRWSHVPCGRCGSAVSALAARVQSGLTRAHEAWTFSRIVSDYPALDEASRQLVSVLEAKKGWVVFTSPAGCGKSYLLAAMVNEARRQSLAAHYTTVAKMLDELQQAVTGRHDMAYWALMRQYTDDIEVLCVDEFGEFNRTDWRMAQIREIFVARSEPVWRPTIFATNWTPADINKHFPWLYSRFHRPEVFRSVLEGVPDLRMEEVAL